MNQTRRCGPIHAKHLLVDALGSQHRQTVFEDLLRYVALGRDLKDMHFARFRGSHNQRRMRRHNELAFREGLPEEGNDGVLPLRM